MTIIKLQIISNRLVSPFSRVFNYKYNSQIINMDLQDISPLSCSLEWRPFRFSFKIGKTSSSRMLRPSSRPRWCPARRVQDLRSTKYSIETIKPSIPSKFDAMDGPWHVMELRAQTFISPSSPELNPPEFSSYWMPVWVLRQNHLSQGICCQGLKGRHA